MALGFSLGKRNVSELAMNRRGGDSGNIWNDIKVDLIAVRPDGDEVFNLALVADLYLIYVYFLPYICIFLLVSVCWFI